MVNPNARSVTFINPNGDRMDFTTEQGVSGVFVDIKGQGKAPVSLYTTQGIRQQGSSYVEALLEPRDLNIEIYAQGQTRTEMDAALRRINALLMPFYGPVQVIYNTTEQGYQIEGIATTTPSYGPRLSGSKQLTSMSLSITCPDPLWQSVDEHEVILSYRDQLFRFPFTLPVMFGVGGYYQDAVNSGSMDAPVNMVIRGPAKTPSIIRDVYDKQNKRVERKRINVNHQLMPYEELVIDTNPDAPIVTLRNAISGEQQDMYSYVDWYAEDVDTWTLAPAPYINRIMYVPGDDTRKAKVTIRWRDRFVGV